MPMTVQSSAFKSAISASVLVKRLPFPASSSAIALRVVAFGTDIAGLKSRGVIELMLDGKVPLVGDRRTDVRIPEADQGALERIGGGGQRRETLTQGSGRERLRRVVGVRFMRERRIDRQAKVSAGSFQIIGQSIRCANHGVLLDIPGNSHARLVIRNAVVFVIQRAVITILVGVFDGTGD